MQVLTRFTTAILATAVCSSAFAGPNDLRPVLRVGGGFASVGESETCEATGPCDQVSAEGVGVLLAGGIESTRGWFAASRLELQIMHVLGRDTWAVAGGPILTLRLLIFEFGGGLALFHAEDLESSLSGWTGIVHLALGVPVRRWTLHAGLDLLLGQDNFFGGLIGGGVSRRF